MNIRELVPKNKSDDSGIEQLAKLSFEEIQPIVPELLEWLQDMNWPVASYVVRILKPFVDRMVPEIISIMKTNDGIWKYWILIYLLRGTKNPILLKEIERIATFPTADEISDEANIEALAILNGEYE